ncbi:MAG: hypothetical protein MHM6MM_009303, partial [Cercozoa sp. M6MM]
AQPSDYSKQKFQEARPLIPLDHILSKDSVSIEEVSVPLLDFHPMVRRAMEGNRLRLVTNFAARNYYKRTADATASASSGAIYTARNGSFCWPEPQHRQDHSTPTRMLAECFYFVPADQP